MNMQRLPVLPMNCGFSSTPTCDAVLLTGHHTTGFPFLKFLTQLRERPLDAAVQGGAAGRKLEQGGYDELEEPEEQQW